VISAEDPALGKALWKMGSAIAHGQQHGLALFYGNPVPHHDPPHADVYVPMQTTAENTAFRCGGAPLAAIAVLRRLYHHYGWATANLQAAVGDLTATWKHIALPASRPASVPATFRP
jgi:hypothetical protein